MIIDEKFARGLYLDARVLNGTSNHHTLVTQNHVNFFEILGSNRYVRFLKTILWCVRLTSVI